MGQDIDPLAAMMSYIQISLLGCPGYIVVGNSLTDSIGGTVLEPLSHKPEDIWFTPLYFSDIWAIRPFCSCGEFYGEMGGQRLKRQKRKSEVLLRNTWSKRKL